MAGIGNPHRGWLVYWADSRGLSRTRREQDTLMAGIGNPHRGWLVYWADNRGLSRTRRVMAGILGRQQRVELACLAVVAGFHWVETNNLANGMGGRGLTDRQSNVHCMSSSSLHFITCQYVNVQHYNGGNIHQCSHQMADCYHMGDQ